METNIQLTLSDIAVAAKRARKRSRYLSPPYTDAVPLPVDDGDEVCAVAADVLSALRAAALLSLDSRSPQAAQALRFLALYRKSRGNTNPLLDDAPAAAGVSAGHMPKRLDLSAGPAPAMPTPAPGSIKRKKKQNPQLPPAPAPAAATRKDKPDGAEAGHKMSASQSDGDRNATNAAPRRRRKSKKMMNNPGHEQVQHFGNPAALVLDFAEGTPLPSREDLLSSFSKFGFLIHSETTTAKDDRRARVVFATRAEAEVAYTCAETLGISFRPPFATPRLQDLPPITLNAPPPVPRLPLKDVRKNLEKMISSLTCRSTSFKAASPAGGNLVGEMQGLLATVDKMLQGASSTVHHN